MAQHEDYHITKLRLEKLGMGGVEPAAPVAKIADATGGATVDAEARAQLALVIDALENMGISSPT